MAETNDRPKLVVLNGSFNPPTLAHLDLLKKAMAAVGAGRCPLETCGFPAAEAAAQNVV